MTQRAPAIFFGHGNPMHALGGPFGAAWRAIGQRLEKPRGVVMVSAHWQTDGAGVTAMARARTIHDFFGFPPELFAVDYPAPGSPDLARRVAAALSPAPVFADQDWGLDHGTWSVLRHVFPDADVPIVQLSLDIGASPAEHLARGRRLAGLREEGILIAGSGDIVHNLALARFRGGEPGEPYDWAMRFNQYCRERITAGDFDALVPGPAIGPDAALSIPTDEHWLPLFYVLGAAVAGEAPAFFTDEIDASSVSMLGVAYGV